ncbi:hypothetical protein K438DRAFT_1452659, partial [Mycena galopus ATCC 62051]
FPLFPARLSRERTSVLMIPKPLSEWFVHLIGRQFKIVLQSTVFQIYDSVDESHFQAWKAVGDLAALLWYPEIEEMDTYCVRASSNFLLIPLVAIGNFLNSFAEIDPSKMITKVKTHLLTHAPSDVCLFGPLLGAITE